jgi:RecA/RadA recombinase|tara:strand:+ start:143 stop:1246 length:1104 start_codon:yes stop_codon:yes gene_type:complete
MSLLDKLVKNSTVKMTAPLLESKVYGKKDMAPTQVPMVNVALSGKIDGGVVPGLLILAGPSKHFKSAFALLMAGAYMQRNPDAVLLFYDAEFGTPQAYFQSFGIDMDRVVHTPITNVEELKFDISQQLDQIEKKEKVIIVIDSIGNLASKKEVEDAMDGKSVADMSRAKAIKSLFRIVTPHLNLKDIPLIAVNHTYKTQEMYSKDVVSGGTGIYYSADSIWIIGRQQDKVGTEIQGYHFIINIEKSRYVKEKSKIPISVSWDGGIMKWSGVMDIAEKGGYLTKPKVGWYEAMNPETGEVLSEKMMRAKEIIDNKEFWLMMLEKTNLSQFIKDTFTIGASGSIMREDDVIDDEASDLAALHELDEVVE